MFGRGKLSVLPAWMTSGGDDIANVSPYPDLSPKDRNHSHSNSRESSRSSARESTRSSAKSPTVSEADNILNALMGTPNTQPMRQSRAVQEKTSVKRNQRYNSSSSRFDKSPTRTESNPSSQSKFSSSSVPVATVYPGMAQMGTQRQNSISRYSSSTSKPIMQLSIAGVSQEKTVSSSSSNSNWQVFKTPEGIEYYYNQRTRETTYTKPDELKSEAELSLKSCPWVEFQTLDGHKYWSNTKTQVSVWEEPKELIAYNAELARLLTQSTTSQTVLLSPKPTTTVQNSPFITTIATPSTAVITQPKEPSPSPEPIVADWSTPEEARAAFESLLRDKNINSNTTWKDAVPLIAGDIRYTAMTTPGQRKQVFSEFISRRVKEEREEKLKQIVAARDAFKQLLASIDTITSRTSYRDTETLLRDDPRWIALGRSDREEEYRYYTQKLDAKERNEKKAIYLEEMKSFKDVLNSLDITAASKWSDFEGIIKEKYTGKSISVNEQKDMLYDLVNAARKEEEVQRTKKIAEVRQSLFDVFDRLVDAGTITESMRYSEVESIIQKEPTWTSVTETASIRPAQLFNDYMDRFRDRVAEEERESGMKCTTSMTFDQFNQNVTSYPVEKEKETKVLAYGNTWSGVVEKRAGVARCVFNRLHHQWEKREKEEEKKGSEVKIRFKELLSEYLYEPIHLQYTFQDVSPQLCDKKRWKAVEKEEQRILWYSEYLTDLKIELEKKKSLKKDHHHHHRDHHHSASRGREKKERSVSKSHHSSSRRI